MQISLGQATDPGRKKQNQDFHGALIPRQPLLSSKGIALAVADGISSSGVSAEAAQSAIKSFLTDYYCTPESWSVKNSVYKVLSATNSWLYGQTRRSQYRYDRDRGYVCTFSGMVLKSTTAHLFHVGDSRIYRLTGQALEQLTSDHRTHLSSQQSYLSRALGADAQLEIDHQSVPVQDGDVFLLTTDGVHDHINATDVVAALDFWGNDLDGAARQLVDRAMAAGSTDNLTVQIVRIDAVPTGEAQELLARRAELPIPQPMDARAELDGLRVLRCLHSNFRSHLYLVQDTENQHLAVLKIPSVEIRQDQAALKRFWLEEWVGRRITHDHVMRPYIRPQSPTAHYLLFDYIEGQTLTQWMRDNPRPHLETVRTIVEQIGQGLRAFHRKEMLHQDARPDNIMIDSNGTIRVVDFGSVRVAGVAESQSTEAAADILGTVQYTAPEYFIGEPPGPWSDVFSLGVITYHMLCGDLPYGTKVSQIRKRRDLGRLIYAPLTLRPNPAPLWVDECLRKATHPDPNKRYGDVAEFLHDLRTPGQDHPGHQRLSLLDSHPHLFWKIACLILLGLNGLQLALR